MTAQDVLNLVRSQLGVGEKPMGSNSGTPYHAWYGQFCEGWQWCAIFVSWVVWHVDQGLFYGLMTAYSGDYLNVGRMHLREIDISQIAPGDICIWDRPVGGITDHIGFVESVTPTTFTTIEGNSGDCVKRNANRPRVQTSSCHYYFVRPNYSAPTPEVEVAIAQTLHDPAHPDVTGLLGGSRKGYLYLDIVNKDTKPIKVTLDGMGPDGGRKTVTLPDAIQPRSAVGHKDFAYVDAGTILGAPNWGNVHLVITADGLWTATATQQLI